MTESGPTDPGAGSDGSALDRALIDEATRKAGLIWIIVAEHGAPPSDAVEPGAARPAWHVWLDGAVYVVLGGREQPLPGLAETSRATVVVPSKDTGGRVVTWSAMVTSVDPASERWTAVTAALAAKRLNAEGGPAMIERWARESTVVRLEPTGDVIESASRPRTASLAARPRPTSATTRGRQPRMIGGVPRRRG